MERIYAMTDFEKIPNDIKYAMDKICEITYEKRLDFVELVDHFNSFEWEVISQQITYIKVMTFYILAEYKQSEKIINLVNLAIERYFNSLNIDISSNELNPQIVIDLDLVFSEYNKIFQIFISDYQEKKQNMTKFSVSDNKKRDMIFLLNVLYECIDDKNKELFLTYIPSFILTFHVNYSKTISKCVNSLKKGSIKDEELYKIKQSLTIVPNLIPQYNSRDFERKKYIFINSFLMVSFYNAIITNYRKNFIVDFLWFERNVGFYQYYLAEYEYSKAVNYISYFEPSEYNPKMDISIPTAFFSVFKGAIPEGNKKLWDILDLVIKDNFPNEMIKLFRESLSNDKFATLNSEVTYNDAIAYFDICPNRKVDPFRNRLMTHIIQSLYYHELLNQEHMVKTNKYSYLFNCSSITDLDNNFRLENVKFNLWYTSDDLINNLFRIVNFTDKYYIVSSVLNNGYVTEGIIDKSKFDLKDSIISTTEIEKIYLNDNIIDKNDNVILLLKNVRFNNLRLTLLGETSNVIDNLFNSKELVNAFCKIHNTNTNKDNEKIYVFLGLNYFMNIDDYSKSRENIISLYVNGLMEYQNFFPVRTSKDLDNMIEKIKRHYLVKLRPCNGMIINGKNLSFTKYCSGAGVSTNLKSNDKN